MKNLLIIILLINGFQLLAQQVGIICDPDGYTNIRSGQGNSYGIIGQIKESDSFHYYQNDKSAWWKVKIPSYFDDSIAGYVHKSRIQPYKSESTTNCKCIGSGIEVNQQPDLIVDIGGKTVTVCGYLRQRCSNTSVKISEFSITDCSSKKMMVFYGALTVCNLTYSNNELEIVELKRLPVGKNFQWIEIPYSKTIVSSEGGNLKLSDKEIILDLTQVTQADVEKFEQEIPNFKKKGYFDDMESFLGKLAVSSMKGSEISKDKFYTIRDYLGVALDGAIKEFYNELKPIIEENKGR